METSVNTPLVDEVVSALRSREAVSQPLAGGGVLHIDRSLPFLLVHRRARGRGEPDEDGGGGVASLIEGEAAYLIGGEGEAEAAARLAAELAEAGSAEFGAFLLLELWEGDAGEDSFEIRAPAGPAPEVVASLERGLSEAGAGHPSVGVRVEQTDDRQPPGMPPLLSIRQSWSTGVLLLGLVVPPVFRDPATGRGYPQYMRRLRRGLSTAIRHAAYEFSRVQTSYAVDDYRALGTRTLREPIFEIDRQLSELERAHKFLILSTPANAPEAWERFRASGYEREPEFHYRLLPVDPDLQKRRLFALPMEDIGDPALESILQEKRRELDLRLGMLSERGTPGFRFGSMRVYGTVDDRLLALAHALLDAVPRRSPGGRTAVQSRVDSRGFRAAAVREWAHYAERNPSLTNTIEVRPDLQGLLVSEGNLMIGSSLRVAADRVEPLIQHEVGTHMLTYANGAAQPLQQLSLGLAGYDELQEGLAVFAEYLVDGLDPARMRLLAARVVAAHSVEQGASFCETFRILTHDCEYTPRSAWHISLRVHESGGHTRDQIYLRGLVRLLEHLQGGGELEPLYVGKIAQTHIEIVSELRSRGVLREPPLTPRFLQMPRAQQRLRAAREGLDPVDLITLERE